METKYNVNGTEYELISLIGHGKSGYSYLVKEKKTNRKYVLKQIHHEPCDYYQFGDDKLMVEYNAYNTLKDINITMPKLFEIDQEQEIIIKEYVEGPTLQELIDKGELTKEVYEQVMIMSKICKLHNLNIDYYPTNFVLHRGNVFYIDYECNEYMQEWSFEVWGKQFYPEF